MAFARFGQHLLAWLDVPEEKQNQITGVSPCHWLEADLAAGTVLHSGTEWHGQPPEPPVGATVERIQASH